MSEKQLIRLAPLGGLQSQRVSDHTLGEVAMRGSFNVEPVDGEWWVRKGEDAVLRRLGSTQWTWIGMGNVKWIIANPYWALQLNSSNPSSGVSNLYTPTATDAVTFAQMSDAATCAAHTPAVGELVLLEAAGYTDQVYRVVAAAGSAFTLDRPYEGGSGAYDCRFIPQLAQDPAGTVAGYSANPVAASYVVYEQLVDHAATSVHGSSPAVTAGRRYLIITSSRGTPVAIDLGVVTTVKRNWFYRTHLASGSETNIASSNGYGNWAAVYKGRLVIANAPDNGNRLASRTLWYSREGDFLLWHVGIKGKTASPNYVTFSGPNDDITGLDVLRESLILHRERSQEIGSYTGSDIGPISFRSNNQGLGLYATDRRAWVHTRGAHWIWTLRGPAVFDGAQVTLVAQNTYRDLVSLGMSEKPDIRCVIHDERRARLYWVLDSDRPGANRHQGATVPDNALRYLGPTAAYGDAYNPAFAVLVYSYEDGEAWLEDRSSIFGGGFLGEPGNAPYRGTYASRYDGTIVKLRGVSTGIDPGISDSSEDHVVQAQVETPWTDFGNTVLQKHLTGVELVLRALSVEENTSNNPDLIDDVWEDSTTDRLFIRLQVFADYDLTTPIADIGKAFLVSDMRARELTDNRQYPAFNLHFSTNGQGRSLKFRVSNTLTAEATAAGYRMSPFRLSEIVAQILPKESTRPTSEMQG